MNNQILIKPKAFISRSLDPKDYLFNKFVEGIISDFGFELFGTVGLYSKSPIPVPVNIRNNIQQADCLVAIGTGRFFQQPIFQQDKKIITMSEFINIEIAMAYFKDIPILVFLNSNVDPGKFIPTITQYINPKYNSQDKSYFYDMNEIQLLIKSTYEIIYKKREETLNKQRWEAIKNIFGVIGLGAVIYLIINDD